MKKNKKYMVILLSTLLVPALLFAKPINRFSTGCNNVEVDKAFIGSANEFGFVLLKKLISNDYSKNIFISPASVLLALAMTNDGADSSTMHAIQSTLELQDFTKDQINSSSAQLMESLMLPDTNVELDIANSLWLNHQYKFRPKFMNDCERNYSAECFVRDFNIPNTLIELNGWVTDKTKGKISRILDELTSDNILVILNAIYFNGKWTYPFDSSKTKKEPFFFSDRSRQDYPRMIQYNEFKYYENSEYQAVSIPYGKRYSMCIVLTKQQDGLSNFISGLDHSHWDDLMTRLRLREGTVELPRFKIDYFKSLAKTLEDLGMKEAFGGKANFNLMTEGAKPFISDVLHKTYLEVNEKGTIAAAVTAVSMGGGKSIQPEPPRPFVMTVDHPFFCVIRDNVTGLNIFAGTIVDPKPDK
jgi:serpin B